MTGRIKGQWRREDGLTGSNVEDEVASWENMITEEMVWVEGDTGNYRIRAMDAENDPVAKAEKKDNAMDAAKAYMRKHAYDTEGEAGTHEKDDIHQYFGNKVELDTNIVAEGAANYLRNNYFADTEIEGEDGIEIAEVTVKSNRNKVYGDVQYAGFRGGLNEWIVDRGEVLNHADDVIDQILQERGLYTKEMWAKVQREKIWGDQDLPTSSIEEEVWQKLGEIFGEKYKDYANYNFRGQ